MFHIIAPFNAEGYAAEGIASEETACDADAPLIASALMLQLGSLFSVVLAMRAFKKHGTSFPVETR